MQRPMMQRPWAAIDGSLKATRDLVIMLSLLFFTWSLAALSAHFLDVYFIVSLVPLLCLAACAYRLWSNLQRERDLRQQAEAMLKVRPVFAEDVSVEAVRGANQANLTDRELEV